MCGYADRGGAATLHPLITPLFLIRRTCQSGFPLRAAAAGLVTACRGSAPALLGVPGLATAVLAQAAVTIHCTAQVTAADSTAFGVDLVEIYELPQ